MTDHAEAVEDNSLRNGNGVAFSCKQDFVPPPGSVRSIRSLLQVRHRETIGVTQNDHLAGRRVWQTFPINEMFSMRILFLHGWTSVTGGVKPTFLKDHGHTVFNPKLPEEAVQIAQDEFDKHKPHVGRRIEPGRGRCDEHQER